MPRGKPKPKPKPTPPQGSTTTTHTYLFVPTTAGATTMPGTFFRLGGYSDIESSPGADPAAFYPRAYKAGFAGATGIVLATNGGLLVHAGGTAHIHSAGLMNIDTQKTLYVNADEDITINSLKTISVLSADSQKITISAGDGTGELKTKGSKVTKEALGEDYEYIDKDTYKYFKANSYQITLGYEQKITCGARFTIWVGTSLYINMALDVGMTFIATILLYAMKFEFGWLKIDLVRWKGEFKDGAFVLANTMFKAATANSEAKAVTGHYAISWIESIPSKVKTGVVDVGTRACQAISGGATSVIEGIRNHL